MRSPRSSPSSTPARSPSTTDGPVLVTGFGPFLWHASNPSEDAVRRFASLGVPGVVTDILPVDVELGPLRALELVGSHGAVALVAFGLDASRPSVMVERLGVNLYEHGSLSRPLTPRGPAAYWSTLPVQAMRDAVRDTGVSCEMSLSAGAFVCNALLYRVLEAGVPACFVHLPADLAPEQGAHVVVAALSVLDGRVPPSASSGTRRAAADRPGRLSE